jgi:hypothetical protein
LPLDIASARLEAARGNHRDAVTALRQVRARAEQAGLKPIAFEAWLAEAQLRGPDSYHELETAAERTGLLAIAKRAHNLH